MKVYGALVEKGKDVADKDWEELDNMAKIKLNGSKCSVSIVPDTEKEHLQTVTAVCRAYI